VLKENEAFGYWSDFGDDWRHPVINAVSIEEQVGFEKVPAATKRVGEESAAVRRPG